MPTSLSNHWPARSVPHVHVQVLQDAKFWRRDLLTSLHQIGFSFTIPGTAHLVLRDRFASAGV